MNTTDPARGRTSGVTLGAFAKAGFDRLSEARGRLAEVADAVGVQLPVLLQAASHAADPDTALALTQRIVTDLPDALEYLGDDVVRWHRWWLLTGSSAALGEFLYRNPEVIPRLMSQDGTVATLEQAKAELLAAVQSEETSSELLVGEQGSTALRVAYRVLLAELMLWDLNEGLAGRAIEAVSVTSEALSSLADAAIEVGLLVARAGLAAGTAGPAVSSSRLEALQLAVIGMGKCGARELNVVSDVDVIYVAGTANEDMLDGDALIRVATRLASELMRVIHDPGFEPALWEIDPNLRPEGRQGALVRTLGSMRAYYERWAKAWEFQALMKARAIAGDRELGEAFVAFTRPMVWSSGGREDFVGSVQRMRERVTEHIALEDVEYQLKLGPGGLRDIEFSVQLLQLVHGQYDERLHRSGTLESLAALVAGGYVARSDGDRLVEAYRFLRVLEHRLQLRDLRRTALMPRDEEELRILARSSQLAEGARPLVESWEQVKRDVRRLHLKIFYAPLLSAVSELPDEEFVLGSDEARARLQSIGFRDPEGAFRHLAALTRGTSRRAKIHRNLAPVLLQWLADGTDPDFGLLAFRRVSEANTDKQWYLRLLRDGYEAAERLTGVLSNSRFIADLLETTPNAVAWLERDDQLRPVGFDQLRGEMRALTSRRSNVAEAGRALRDVHRREVLRLAMGRVVGVLTERDVSLGLDAAHTALLDSLLLAVREHGDEIASSLEISLIAMGRYGGGELGFASDIDLIAVYRAPEDVPADKAQRAAVKLVSEMKQLVSDPRFSVDLDFDLRPEGKNGPLVRSLSSYRSYYQRWSVDWEAQALLRARAVAGDAELGQTFIELADEIRYPAAFSDEQVREVRRIKARVEAERLPQGANPKLHLKLGPGGISDVEWLVQLLQLQHGAKTPAMRTSATLEALSAAVEAGWIELPDAELLQESWEYASTIRSALKLASGRASDVLPTDWAQLVGVAGILGHPRDQTTELSERWLSLSRRARAVFEREFFGYEEPPLYTAY